MIKNIIIGVLVVLCIFLLVYAKANHREYLKVKAEIKKTEKELKKERTRALKAAADVIHLQGILEKHLESESKRRFGDVSSKVDK